MLRKARRGELASCAPLLLPCGGPGGLPTGADQKVRGLKAAPGSREGFTLPAVLFSSRSTWRARLPACLPPPRLDDGES